MSQGTLYVTDQARAFAPKALVKYFNLDIAIENKEAPAYKAAFPLNKIPAFIGPKGFKLTEIIAVSVYRMYLFVTLLFSTGILWLQ